MHRTLCSAWLGLLAMVTSVQTMVHAPARAGNDWPQWRGFNQSGVAPGNQFPIRWHESSSNDQDSTNIAWKVPMPGRGGSTPVVAGSTAFLTYGNEGANHLVAIDIENGKTKWDVDLGEDRGNKHRKGGGSNPSAVTDGKWVFAYFRSGDLACVDVDGNRKWQTNLQERFGEDTLWWDLGTSPLLTDSAVVVAVMQSGPSYLVAFDKQSGELLWKTDRLLDAPEEAAQSYTTPVLAEVEGRKRIAVMGADHLTLHDLESGKELARLGGFNPDQDKFFRSIASPVVQGELIVCPYARGETLTAVDMRALLQGKQHDAIIWSRVELGSDVPTPAAKDGIVYLVGDGKTNRSLITCLDGVSGMVIWEIQLPKSRNNFSSSPLIAGDYLYVLQEDAVTYVIGPLSTERPELIATNQLDDDTPFTVASPTPVNGNSLLIRTRDFLYRIGR